MVNRFVILISLLFLSLLVASCNYNSDKQSVPQHLVTKIIPKYKDGRIVYSYEMTKKYTKESGLSIIENGFDSIFFRIWYIYMGTIQVTDFKKQEGVWVAEFHIIKLGLDTVNNDLKVDNFKSSKISPKSGWDFFINKILSLNIMTLPDASEIPGYYDGMPTDAEFVVVEIATTTKYRIYDYTSPMLFPEIKEAKAMEDIMLFLEEEFGIKRLSNF